MTPLGGPVPPRSRLEFVDAARGLAVMLALWGHAVGQFDVELPTLIFTRTATPTFLVIFGIMIEVVYLRKLRETGSAGLLQIRRRFVERAITCYLLFALIALAALATGKIDGERFLGAVTYTGSGRFGNILRLYALLFLALLPALPLLARHGAQAMMAAAAAAWLLSWGFAAIGAPAGYTAHMMLGFGVGAGPAVFLSLVLVGFGMMIGEMLGGRGPRWPVVLLWCGAVFALAVACVDQGPQDLARNITTLYRGMNHWLYFAYGLAAAGASLAAFAVLQALPRPVPGLRLLAFCGQQTLFLYGFGNIVLNLLPRHDGSLAADLVAMALFFLVLTLLAQDRRRPDSLVHGLTGGVFLKAGDAYGRAVAAASARIADPTPGWVRNWARGLDV